MKMKIAMNGSCLEIAPEGRLDMITAPSLEKEMNDRLPAADQLILDFSDLEYISSAGLRVLLRGHKMMQSRGGMKIIHPNEIVREVFELTGFSGILDIE